MGYRNESCAAEASVAFGDLEPHFAFRSDDNTTVQCCVAAGVGVCLAPMLAIDLDDPTTTIVEATAEICAKVAERMAAERAA